MKKSLHDNSGYKSARKNTKFYGIISAILLAIIIGIPSKEIQLFAMLGLAVTVGRFLFEATTAISISLEGLVRKRFQIAVVLITPSLLSIYFIKDASPITLEGVGGHMLNTWFLVALGFISFISWTAADLLNKEHPFRGFLIATVIIFIICLMGYNGYHLEDEYYTETSTVLFDKDSAEKAAVSGRYFGQFVVYIAASYSAMLLGYLKRNK